MKKGQKNFSKKRGASSKSRIARELVPERLPQLQDQLHTSVTLRFYTTTVFTGVLSITSNMLMDAWFLAGTAALQYALFDFVRLRKVTIRGMGRDSTSGGGAATLAPMATVSVEYFGVTAGASTGGRQKSDTSLGYDVPAMVSLAPDPKSQAAQWQPNSTAVLFAIRAVDQTLTPLAGAIIDVEVSYRNSGDVAPSAVSVPRAGLVPGAIYYGGLDGQPLATTAAISAFTPRA